MIYADNAATTPLDKDAFEAMKSYWWNDFGNPSQPYSLSRSPKSALKSARETIANCIGADPDEIYFTSCGTESDNWVVKEIGCDVPENTPSTEIITSEIEHHAILNSCAAVERMGCAVKYISPSEVGEILGSALQKVISSRTRLVSVMMVNNEIGTIQPIRELCEIAHQNGSLFHTDAVQAVGHIPINVHELGVDFMSASAHKFNGPKGIGFLYVKKGTKIRPYMSGGAQERGLRAGTENVPLIVGMAKALEKNCSFMKETQNQLARVEDAFLDALRKEHLDFIRNGSARSHIPGNVSVSFRDVSGEMLLHRLDLKKIYISTGSACDSKNTQVSHVIRAIKVPADYAQGTIRVSFGKQNTVEEAQIIGNQIANILKAE